MASVTRERQEVIRWYKHETGDREIDMHEVARFAVQHGWPLPTPTDPLDQLAAQFAHAAREEIRHDQMTGRPYRANHAVPYSKVDGRQLYLWIDIDEAPRGPMWKSLINRREQIVGDALQLSFDTEHWNAMHPDEAPIIIPLDFSDDVEWRKNAPEERSA